MKSNFLEQFRANEKISIYASQVLIAFLMVCVSISVMQLVSRINPELQLFYLPWLAIIITAESMYTQRRLVRSEDLNINPFIFIVVEWVVILVIIKLLTYIDGGLGNLWAEIPLWRDDFITYFLTGEFILIVVFSLFVWLISRSFGNDLQELAGDENIIQNAGRDHVASNRTSIRQGMANKIIAIGCGMAILTALTRLDQRMLWGDQPIPQTSVIYILAYFLFGLTLLSLTQFSTQRAIWAWDRVSISPGLAKKWLLYSLIFLFILVVVALILPTEYSLGLLPTIRTIVAIVFEIILAIVSIIWYPIFLLYGFLSSLFKQNQRSLPEQPIEPFTPPEFEALPNEPNAWFTLLKSILFWGFFIGLISYAVYQYVSQNKELLEKLHRIPGLTKLAVAWRWLIQQIRTGIIAIPAFIQNSIGYIKESSRQALRRKSNSFINLRRYTPRQQFLFYYLAMVRRGGEKGYHRQPNATPYEYSQILKRNLPEINDEIANLTDSFIEARYSQHDIKVDKARQVRGYWEIIRKVIRNLQ